jgi:hypothetical protein
MNTENLDLKGKSNFEIALMKSLDHTQWGKKMGYRPDLLTLRGLTNKKQCGTI